MLHSPYRTFDLTQVHVALCGGISGAVITRVELSGGGPPIVEFSIAGALA